MPETTNTETFTIYDELNRPYLVEAEAGGTRVLRIIEGPKPEPSYDSTATPREKEFPTPWPPTTKIEVFEFEDLTRPIFSTLGSDYPLIVDVTPTPKIECWHWKEGLRLLIPETMMVVQMVCSRSAMGTNVRVIVISEK